MPLLLIPGDPKSIRNSLSEVQDHDLNYIISDIYKFKKKKKKRTCMFNITFQLIALIHIIQKVYDLPKNK